MDEYKKITEKLISIHDKIRRRFLKMSIKQNHILEFKHVSFQYNPSQPIVDTLNFRIKPGEFISIVGASGTGKSTIFRLIVGLEQPRSGDIFINGVNEANRLGKVGYMPQRDLLVPWRTVLENIALPLEAKGRIYDPSLVIKKLENIGLAHIQDKYPHELSGGMRQRVSFLRASLSNSELLLLDEPFSALDAMTKMHMQEWLLDQWNQTRSSIVFITHDILEALFLSDRIFVIHDTPIQMVEEINVPLERPRNRQQLDSPEVIELKNDLIQRFKIMVSQ